MININNRCCQNCIYWNPIDFYGKGGCHNFYNEHGNKMVLRDCCCEHWKSEKD